MPQGLQGCTSHGVGSAHVLLEAKKGQLAVSATDLDLAVSSEHELGVEILKEGSLAVSARHLYEIVRALPEQQVTLKKAHNNYLELKSGPSEFRIVGLPAEDFPALPRFEKVPFGVQAGLRPHESHWTIPEDQVASLAKAGAEVVLTVYGAARGRRRTSPPSPWSPSRPTRR